jgi:uncharacterized repeat protein (TIGR01451 family)
MLIASSVINTNNIIVKHGVGGITTVPTATLNSVRKTVSGTTDWVTYYISGITGDVSVQANGPVAVAYLGIQGAAGVAGYFSGFGTIPTINVQTNGNGCLPNTTLSAPTGFNSYIWYKNGTALPNATTNTYTPTSVGDYNVEVSNGFCNFSSAVKTVFDCNPEVVIKNTASNNYLLPGETTTFTIKVKVYSDNVAQNVQISNLLPAHLDYTSSTMTKGTFTGTGSNYTWNIGTMSNGEENTLTVLATAQTVTSAYSENYVVDNTQTFSSGIEVNSITDDKIENVVIYPGCSSSLAGTISGTATLCSTTNSTTLTVTNAVGDLQWQSSTDNNNFTDINGATASTLVVTNLASTAFYRVKTTVAACVEYASSISIIVAQNPDATVTLNGAACINKTSLTAVSGLSSYTWYKDNVIISGATSNTYTPTAAGDYKVDVSNGTCTNTSSIITISYCGLTRNGELIPIKNSSTVVNKFGAINSGKGIDEKGMIISKPWEYGTVTTATGRIWMDRNLGATRVALNSTDALAYGDYFQWGRPADGHQTNYLTNNNSSGYTNTKSTSSVPTNSLWIVPTDSSNDWLNTPDNTLWTGSNPANNPCPEGFRIPTEAEWNAEKTTWISSNAAGAFASPLKLTRPGMLTGFDNNGASYTAKDNFGQYVTQIAYSNGGVRYFGIEPNNAWFDQNYYKWNGMSCRCIKD